MFFPELSNEQVINRALVNVLYYLNDWEIIDLIRANPYFDFIYPKKEYLDYRMLALTYHEKVDKYFLIAEKIRKIHFPSPGLGSTIIVHGLE